MPSDDNPWHIGGPPPPPGNPPPRRPRPPQFDEFAGRLLHAWNRLRHEAGPTRLAVAGILAAILLWLLSGLYRVQPDQEALVLQFGAYNRTALPGLNWHIPFPVESVLKLPVTRINRVEIGFVSDSGDTPDTADAEQQDRDLREESLMLTGDENIVDINASIFWRIRDAEAYAFNTRNPAATVKAAAESMLRQVVGHTKIQSALTEGRALIEQAVTTGTQAILDQYGTGVEITQVQLQKVDPPPDVIESFRDVQRANTDADRARNEAQAYANDIVPRARGEAAAVTAAAQGDKLAAIATAKGESQRFLSVYAAYVQAKDVTLKRLYIETMQEILSHADTTVIDDKLRSILPTLTLNRQEPPK